jgi:hypothetical protein
VKRIDEFEARLHRARGPRFCLTMASYIKKRHFTQYDYSAANGIIF